jgi:hypothetical protein
VGQIPGDVGDQYYRKPKWLRRMADPLNLFPEDGRRLSRKMRRHPELDAEASGAAERERTRRAAQGQRRTILSGALGPASRGSVLSGA